MGQKRFQRIFFIGIILIAIGVSFNTTMRDSLGSIGTVMIALGGLFFIAAMAEKRKMEKEE
ncbi:MAG: hypothetical protein DWQ02_19680 [Bacteroidetes bacterium]|nr:MAG: hypothetical protein DWQ02_19680 [Bacteroidota bacterium]